MPTPTRSRVPRVIGFLIALLCALSLVSPAAAQTPEPVPAAQPALPARITDVNGDEVVVSDVSRIIPLNGHVAETLFALGLGANVVAVDASALYPPEARALPKIGYQRELSAEGILSFEPTLVIGTEEAGPADVIDQVRAAGVTVVILPSQTTAAGAAAGIRAIGQAVGLPTRAGDVATRIEERLAEAARMAAEAGTTPRVAFLYLRGAGTQMIAGADTSAHAVLTAAGAINVGAEIGIRGYAPITPEALVEAAPEVLVLMQHGLASVGGVDGLLEIPGIAQTPAGEARNVVAFEDLYLLGFGPRLGDAIYDLTLALHPALEGEPLHPEWQGIDVMPQASPEASPAA